MCMKIVKKKNLTQNSGWPEITNFSDIILCFAFIPQCSYLQLIYAVRANTVVVRIYILTHDPKIKGFTTVLVYKKIFAETTIQKCQPKSSENSDK